MLGLGGPEPNLLKVTRLGLQVRASFRVKWSAFRFGIQGPGTVSGIGGGFAAASLKSGIPGFLNPDIDVRARMPICIMSTCNCRVAERAPKNWHQNHSHC